MVSWRPVACAAGGLATALGVAAVGGALVGLIGYDSLEPIGTSAFVGYKAAIYGPLLVVPVAVGLGVAVVVAGAPKSRWIGLAAGAGAAVLFWLVAVRVSVAAGAAALRASHGFASATYDHYYRQILATEWVVWSALETAMLVALVLGMRVVADRYSKRPTVVALAGSAVVTVLLGLVYAAIAIRTDHGLHLVG